MPQKKVLWVHRGQNPFILGVCLFLFLMSHTHKGPPHPGGSCLLRAGHQVWRCLPRHQQSWRFRSHGIPNIENGSRVILNSSSSVQHVGLYDTLSMQNSVLYVLCEEYVFKNYLFSKRVLILNRPKPTGPGAEAVRAGLWETHLDGFLHQVCRQATSWSVDARCCFCWRVAKEYGGC